MTATRELVSNDRSKFDFKDEIVYLAETKRGLTRETVEEISALQGRARLDAPVPAARLRALPEAADAEVGRRPRRGSTSTKIDVLPQAVRARGEVLGRRPGADQGRRSRSSASRRRSASSSPASAPSTTRRSSTTRCAEELSKLGVVFMGTDQALKEYPEIFRKYFGTVVPAGGQQVRRAQQRGLVGRLVRLRAEGRRGAAAAPGVLPHQRREHRASSSGR